MTNGDWITSATAVLALVTSVAALIVAIRSSKRPAVIETPPPAPPAAPITPTMEVIEPPDGVAWRISHDAGISWRLENFGTEPAYDVNAVGLPAESAGLVRIERSFVDVPAGGALGFHVVRTAHHPNVTGLAVTWSGQDSPVVVPLT
jgi:hypothetical protein